MSFEETINSDSCVYLIMILLLWELAEEKMSGYLKHDMFYSFDLDHPEGNILEGFVNKFDLVQLCLYKGWYLF
jgi:hypothetical protein